MAGISNIVQVADSTSRAGGGIYEAMLGLSIALAARQDSKVSAISAFDHRSLEDRATWHGVPVDQVVARSKIDLLTGRHIAAALRAAKPDLVHLHGVWGVAARGLSWWLRRESVPYVVSPHGMFDRWALARSAVKKRLSRVIWEDAVLRGAAFLHALNDAEADAIRAMGLRNPVCVIPNGVALPTLAGPSSRTEQRRTLLFIGRLHPKKGLQELLQAWALLPTGIRRDWRLRIAGWDEIGLLPNLLSVVQALGLGDSVEFVGPAYGEEKDALFRSSSAFILPSHSEGLPMAVLEAWSYELPVFMTAACNLPKGFTAGAAFEISTAPASIALVLASALNDDAALTAAGRNGRGLVERDHSWSVIAREMSAAYAGALR